MSEAVVGLVGILVQGRHGASPGETNQEQGFVIDLEVAVDVAEDRLGATADYREVARVARASVNGEPVVLLETLALRVAVAVAALDHVVRVRATVHKPRAAGSVGVHDVSATATAGERR
jgi:dihydroneopterin aldolase